MAISIDDYKAIRWRRDLASEGGAERSVVEGLA